MSILLKYKCGQLSAYFLVIFLLLFKEGSSDEQQESQDRCEGINEEFTCGTVCPATCENYKDQRPCTMQCMEGCFCKEGYVRDSGGVCVLPEMCENKPLCSMPICEVGCDIDYNTEPCPSCKCEGPQKCGESEVYVECVPCTNHTCETYEKGIYCKQACRPGCTCKEGLVKRKDGKCVSPKECDIPTSPLRCSEGEEYVECVPCANTCETYEQRFYCKPACRPGCTCKNGMVKRKDGKCVPPEECDIPTSAETPPQECGMDEQYYDCGPTCRNTCENYDKQEPCLMYCRPGCFCKKDLVRRKDGRCVEPSRCNN